MARILFVHRTLFSCIVNVCKVVKYERCRTAYLNNIKEHTIVYMQLLIDIRIL